MADHIWMEKSCYRTLWKEVKILNKEEHCRIRLKESAHMLDLLSWPSTEINTIREASNEERKTSDSRSSAAVVVKKTTASVNSVKHDKRQ